MKFLTAVFLAMVVYGVAIGHLGGAILALFMVWFCWWGARVLDKRDADYNADPRNAKPMPDTLEVLESQACECSRPDF